MASEIYINHEDLFLELTCTSDVTVTYSSQSSTAPVEQGADITDHVTNSPVTITFSGIISEIKNYSLDYHMPTEDLIKKLTLLWRTRVPFSVNVSNKLDTFQECVFTDFGLTKTSGMGDSWKAQLTMKEIRRASVIGLSEFPEQEKDTSNQHEAKSNQGDGSTEEERDTSNIAKIVKLGTSTIGKLLDEEEEGDS